jgi:hypothetical protein
MAAMSNNLTVFSTNGDSVTYRLDGHTMAKPQLVLQRRRPPVGSSTVQEDEVSVVFTTEDADGNVIATKILLSAKIRRDQNSDSTDLANALAAFRDIVAGDEFTAVFNNSDRLLIEAG